MEAPNPRPDPHPELSTELRALLPRLLSFAARILRSAGWGEGRDHCPSAVAAEEVVQEAVTRYLANTRTRPDGVSLACFLFGVVRSLASHQVDALQCDVETASDDTDSAAAPSSQREETLHRLLLLADIERELHGGDPDVEKLFGAYKATRGDSSRGDIAAMLGWTPEHVTAVRAKMLGRLARMGFTSEESDERLPEDRPRGPAPAPRRRTRR